MEFLSTEEILKRKNKELEEKNRRLKVEKYYLKKYRKLEELEKAISSYVKFYNEERLQKNLRERSPLEYRKLNK